MLRRIKIGEPNIIGAYNPLNPTYNMRQDSGMDKRLVNFYLSARANPD
jgi:hypothetical protein